MKMTETLTRPDALTPDDEPLTDTGADRDYVVLGAIAVQHGPIGDIAASSDGVTLVVTNYGDNSVSLIAADTLTADATVTVGGEAFAAAATDDRAYVSTASASYDSVSVIDTGTRTLITTHPLALNVTGLAVGPDGKHVFASRAGRDGVDLAVIDTTSDRVGTVDLATGPGMSADAVRVSPDGQRVYVATSDTYGDNLVVVDAETARVAATVTIWSTIRDVALSPDGSAAYVLSYDPARGGAITIIDTTTNDIAADLHIGGTPIQMALSPDGTRAYVVDHDHVAVLCTMTNEVIDTITVGAQPSCVAASPDGGRLYVADYAGVVTAFSVASDTYVLQPHVTAIDVAVPKARETEPATVPALISASV